MRKTTTILSLIFCSGLYLPVKSQNCTPSTSASTLDINNVSALVQNGGDMWWDYNLNRYEVPKGSGKKPFFVNSLWLTAKDDDGNVHSAAVRFRQVGNDYWPGPIFEDSNGIQSTMCNEFNRHWNLTKAEVDNFAAGNTTNIPDDIMEWPAKGNPHLTYSIDQEAAPFVDVNSDGIYDPDSGDYPAIKGDQAVYWILNDIGNVHTESGGLPLGVEIHVMAYAYIENNVVNNTTFYDYRVVNRSASTYDDFRLGFFTDVDLGDSQDDFIGCDSTRNLGYCFNADSIDNGSSSSVGYGTELPIVGIRMVNLPIDANGDELGMTHFGYFNNGPGNTGDPNVASDYHNYMSGKWKDGAPWTAGGFGGNGNTEVNYVFPGNPADTNTWTECSAGNPAGDRRMIQSHGPQTVYPEQTIGFTMAAIYSQRDEFETSCPDVSLFLYDSDTVAQYAQDRKCDNFDVSISANVTPSTGTDGAIDIILSGTNGMYSYDWSNGAETKTISGLATGSYDVTVSNEFGCSAEASFTVNPVGMEDRQPLAELKVYPNPSKTGVFHITGVDRSANVRVYDLLGSVVGQQSIANGTVQLDHLSDGVYLLEVGVNGHSSIERIVIAR